MWRHPRHPQHRKLFSGQPIFGFEPDGVLCGIHKDSNTPFLALFGTVTNRGDKPLNPRGFDLKIKVHDKWLSLDSLYLPDNVEHIFNSETQRIIIKDIDKMDLQEWKEPIVMGQPARGCLLFWSKEFDPNTLKSDNSLTFKLTCVDIFNKKYTITSTFGPFADFKEQRKLIKYNVSFGPKNN